MEETNYSRNTIIGTAADTSTSEPQSPVLENEKTANLNDKDADVETALPELLPASAYKPKTYMDKIKLVRSADMQKSNRLLGMVKRPLIFLTFPVIFYAGFSYGSNVSTNKLVLFVSAKRILTTRLSSSGSTSSTLPPL